MNDHKEETTWIAPELTEFEIADRTQAGDGPTIDGTDPAPETS